MTKERRDPIGDAMEMLGLIYQLIRPQRRTAEMIESISQSFANTIAVAMGGSAKVEMSKRCLKHIAWPNTEGGWVVWYCPLPLGHTHPHSDENFFSIYDDDVIALMWEQYRLFHA